VNKQQSGTSGSLALPGVMQAKLLVNNRCPSWRGLRALVPRWAERIGQCWRRSKECLSATRAVQRSSISSVYWRERA